LSSLLGLVFKNLLDASFKPKEMLFCSNIPAMDVNNIPILNISLPDFPTTDNSGYVGATSNNITHANILIPPLNNVQTGGGPPGALGSTLTKPCIYAFGPYVKNDTPLTQDVNRTLFAALGSIGNLLLKDR
jgi:hypothetical protein